MWDGPKDLLHTDFEKIVISYFDNITTQSVIDTKFEENMRKNKKKILYKRRYILFQNISKSGVPI
jgi:hypothetical protein